MDIKCPISNQIFNDPILASDGFFYEEQVMRKWFRSNDSVSPMTREELNPESFRIYEFNEYIKNYLELNPDKKKDQYVITNSNTYLDNKDDVHDAIYSQQYEELLKYTDYDLTIIDSQFYYCDNKEVLEYVVDNSGTTFLGPNYNKNGDFERREVPLHCACAEGNLELVKILLSKGADPNFADEGNWRAIHYVSQIYNVSKTRRLNSYVEYNNGYAARETKFNDQLVLDIVNCLFAAGADLECENNHGSRPIHYAIRHTNLVKLLLDHNVEIECENSLGIRPIHFACKFGSIKSLKILIDKGVNMECEDHNGNKPIHMACGFFNKNSDKLLELLVEKNPNLDLECENGDGMRPIHQASSFINHQAMKFLISKGVDLEYQVKKSGMRPIHYVCDSSTVFTGKPDNDKLLCLQLLIAADVDINCFDEQGLSPIHHICYGYSSMSCEYISCLVQADANIEIEDKFCNRPIHLACQTGDNTVVEFLASYGADLEAKNYCGWTTIMATMLPSSNHIPNDSKKLNILKFLIEKGISITHEDNSGWNCLFMAAKTSTYGILNYLLDIDELKQTVNNKMKESNLKLYQMSDLTDNITFDDILATNRELSDLLIEMLHEKIKN